MVLGFLCVCRGGGRFEVFLECEGTPEDQNVIVDPLEK